MKSKPFIIRPIINGALTLLLAVALFSCSSNSELANHIPKEANMVVAFDIKSMSYKSLDLNQILTLDNVKKALSNLGKKDTTTAKFENSGIDFLSKAYMFGKAEESAPYGGVIVALSDAATFETFIKQFSKDLVVKKEGELSIATVETDVAAALVWNTNTAILLFGKEKLKETAVSLFSLKEENSLASNNTLFSELEKEAADISCWINFSNFDKLAQAYNPAAGAGMMNFKDTYLAATCNFEDGQIVVNTKYTTNKENAEKLSFIKKNVNADIAKSLPGQTVIGMAGFALDMQKLQTYLAKENLLEGYAPFVTQYTGLTVDEMFGMLSGDMAVTVNGIKMAEVKRMNWSTGEEFTTTEPQADYCAALGIAKKESLQKLLSYLEQAGMVTKGDKYYSFHDKVFVTEQGSTLLITGMAESNQKAVDGKNEKLNDELAGMLTDNATSFYFNLGNVPQELYATAGPVVASNITGSEVVDILATGTNTSETVATGKFVIRFKNKSENSLVTLTRVTKKFAEGLEGTPVVSALSPATEVVEEGQEEAVN